MSQRDVDQALVERVQQGELAAFDLLVRKYQGKVTLLISHYIKDPVEAQDVCQEVFFKAFRALQGFRGDSAFYTWLFRIAVNMARNHLVTKRRRPPAADIDVQILEQHEGSQRLRDIQTPERLLLKEEIEETIFAAIQQLPEELRSAIVLRELEGLSYAEIAQAMACPIGTVRSRIFRARAMIDLALKPLLE